MLVARVISRAPRSVGQRASLLLPFLSSASQKQPPPILSCQLDSLLRENTDKFVGGHMSLLHHSAISSSPFSRFGFSTSASPETSEKEQGSTNGASSNPEPANAETRDSKETGFNTESQPNPSHSTKRRRGGTKRTAFSDSDSEAESDLSMDDMVKLVAEKEELLKSKHKEIEQMQDKVLRAYAEMENVMERTKRDAESSKKFAIQNFAKGLLDVADNLGRASSVVKDSFSKIDTSNDTSGAVPLLKTLLEGVEMTEKQLLEVFMKFGVEKYDPINEPFDPHRHNAVFQIPDSSKPPGTVATVLKAGYVLYDRVIRPAEVGVTHVAEIDVETKE